MAGDRRHHHDQLSASPYAQDGDCVRVSVRVTPRAKTNLIKGFVKTAGGKSALEVRLAAPPVDDAANKALVALLAASLGVPKSAVTIVAGEASRLKVVRVGGMSVEALARRLERPDRP